MSKDNRIQKLLEKANKLQLEDFEYKNSMKNISLEVIEFIKRKTEVERKNGREYLFTPKMLHEIFEENNSKYFADFLWTHSDNPKNLKKNPKNRIFFTSPRRSVYKLIEEAKTSS